MFFAEMRLTLAVLAAAAALVLTGCSDRDYAKVVREKAGGDVVEATSEPMDCVGLYYNAVLDGDHRQYQRCVATPRDAAAFRAAVEPRLAEMKAKGLERVSRPVRSRTELKGEVGDRRSSVRAVSPWTGKEAVYDVAERGQRWVILEER